LEGKENRGTRSTEDRTEEGRKGKNGNGVALVVRSPGRTTFGEGAAVGKLVAVIGTVVAFAGAVRAQDCKAKFAVGYTDGRKMQTGLTQEQRKYWDKEGAKKFKGMCLDFAEPD